MYEYNKAFAILAPFSLLHAVSRMFAETTFPILIVPWLSNEQIRSVVVETGGKLPLNSIYTLLIALLVAMDFSNVSLYPNSMHGIRPRGALKYNLDVDTTELHSLHT